ncbi:MAG: oligosaccharide flippase family protein [Candidatus Brocadiales bacterium]|nr:oligosaccharide flippase family protein [Candidatus Brocadiales bacterium]
MPKSNTTKTLFSNILYLGSSQGLLKFITLAITVYLVRVLSVEMLGKLAFAQMLGTFIPQIMTDFGIQKIGTRNVARDRSHAGYYLVNIILIRLVYAVLTFVILALVVWVLPKDLITKKLIIFFIIAAIPQIFLVEWIFQGIEKMSHIGISRLLDKIVYVGLLAFLVKSSDDIMLVPAAWFVGSACAVVYLLVVYLKEQKIKVEIDIRSWKSLAVEALPMGLSGVMMRIFQSFNVILLGLMSTDYFLGIFNVAYRVTAALTDLSNVLSLSIFPLLSRYYHSSRENLEILITRAYKYITVISFLMIVVGYLLAKPWIPMIFGDKYIESVLVFQILIVSVAAFMMRTVFVQSALACDRQSVYMKGTSIGMVVNIVFNLLLIPLYDAAGAAVATVVSDIVLMIYLVWTFDLFSRRYALSYIIKPLIAASGMVFTAVILSHLNVYIVITVATSLYFIVLILLRYLSMDDIYFIKRNFANKK